MASEKVIAQKQEIVANLKEKLTGSVAGVLVDYKGINVAEDTKLRKELREAGVDYTVVKNTLLKFAIDEVGFGALDAHLSGTTALAVSKEDPVIAAKILAKYAEGEVIDSDKVIAVGKLPSKEQLLVQLLSVLNGNIRGLAVALNAIAEKGQEEAPAVEA